MRSSLLGDIVNSNVVYSGAPGKGFTGAGYSAFAAAYASRTPAVFLSANDGMLHAFNASTGAELFGFIPRLARPKTVSPVRPPLSQPPIKTMWTLPLQWAKHKWHQPMPRAIGKPCWLQAPAGAALEYLHLMSDPAAFDASKVMWEFKRTDDTDIGQVIGQPRIMKFRTSGGCDHGNLSLVCSGGQRREQLCKRCCWQFQHDRQTRAVPAGAG